MSIKTTPFLILAMLTLVILVWSASAAPTTQTQNDPPRVLVVPFIGVDVTQDTRWIGKGIQQNLIAELSRLPSVRVITIPQTPLTPADAIELARQAGARFVVVGAYQILDPELRLTGQVLDTQAGQSINGLKATGTVRDLFLLEDTIAQQVRRALPQPPAPTLVQDAQPAQQTAATDQNGPVRVDVGNYEGSNLQKAVNGGMYYSPLNEDQYNRYRYGDYGSYYYGQYYNGYGGYWGCGWWGGYGGYGPIIVYPRPCYRSYPGLQIQFQYHN